MQWSVPDIMLARAFLRDRSERADKSMKQEAEKGNRGVRKQ